MPYDPADPLKDRITDIGPRYFKNFFRLSSRTILANGSTMKFFSQECSFT